MNLNTYTFSTRSDPLYHHKVLIIMYNLLYDISCYYYQPASGGLVLWWVVSSSRSSYLLIQLRKAIGFILFVIIFEKRILSSIRLLYSTLNMTIWLYTLGKGNQSLSQYIVISFTSSKVYEAIKAIEIDDLNLVKNNQQSVVTES